MAGRRVAPPAYRVAVPLSVGIVGLALIGVGQAVPNRHSIESDLTTRSSQALQKADLVGLTVSFSGRDATITGAGQTELAQKAVDVVAGVDGVRVAKAKLAAAGSAAATPAPAQTASPGPTATASTAPTETTTPTEAPTATAAVADIPLGFTLADGAIKVTGTVQSQATGDALISAVRAAGQGWTVTDKLSVDPALAAEPLAADRFPALTRLIAAAPTKGSLLVIQYNADSVILRGKPATAAAERKLLTAAAGTVKSPSGVLDGLDVPKKS
jgi:hypothetical protein